MPPGMEAVIPYDVADFIRASIHEVITTLVEALVIVVVIIFLFLGTIRSVVIPVVTIPLSLVGAGIVMLALGFSINLLTLLAIVLAIGLVVDDAIVVVENVYRHIEEGQTPLEAALNGAREIIGPVIAMTITLAAVYAPIGFLGGVTGALFREFAFTLAGAVIVSGVVALTLSPMMTSVMLKQHMHDNGFGRLVDRVFESVTHWYANRLKRFLEFPNAMAVFIVGVIFSVGFLYLHTSAELAPVEDPGVAMGLVKGPQGSNVDYTAVYAREVGKIAHYQPEMSVTFSYAGMQGPNTGFVAMKMHTWDHRKRNTTQVLTSIQNDLNKLDGVNAFAFMPPSLPGSVGFLPVSMVIYSPDDYLTVYNAMDRIKTAARQSGLFIATDSDLTFNNSVIHLNIDRSKAHDLGISMQDIGDTLATLVGENYINRFNMEGHAYEVVTQVPRTMRLNADALTQFYVRTASGQQIPLSTVVSPSTNVEPNSLPRYGQLNSATFSAMPMPGVSMGEAVDFLREQARTLPRSFNTDFLSNSRQYVQEGNQLLYTFFFALLVIYLVLAAQFESLRDPLVILISVPMSICGALLPLFIGLSTINIYTQVGLVTLIGLISKHGILMVSFARSLQISKRVDKRTAIVEAARVRLRPILMTTAAMVAGLLPLLLASGAGSGARYAIGLVVVSGMAIGTMFTIFVLPMVYLWLATDHSAVAMASQARAAGAPAE
jgi:multidrug efflux pump